MRSIYDAVGIVTTVSAQAVSGTTALNGTTVDTLGYNTAMLHVNSQVALYTQSATLVVTLQESADNVTWTTAQDNTAANIGFTLPITAMVAAPGAIVTPVLPSASCRIEGLGLNRKRYLRAVITPAITTGSATLSATILLGRAFEEPVRTAVSNT